MTIVPRIDRRRRHAVLVAVVLTTMTGCAERTTRLSVTAFVQPGEGEVFVEHFPTGAYATNARGDYQIIFELPPKRMPVNPPDSPSGQVEQTADADPATTPIAANRPVSMNQAPDEVYIAQLVLIDMLWRPNPGTTFAESSQTNAGISYCLLRGRDTVRYEGAGFVSFDIGRDGMMTGRIESATLYPTAHTSDTIDVLGPCRLTGEFVAESSRRRVVDVRRRLETQAAHPDRWIGSATSN